MYFSLETFSLSLSSPSFKHEYRSERRLDKRGSKARITAGPSAISTDQNPEQILCRSKAPLRFPSKPPFAVRPGIKI